LGIGRGRYWGIKGHIFAFFLSASPLSISHFRSVRMCDELTKPQCLQIARSTLIATRGNAMREEVHLRAELDDNRLAQEAAVHKIIMRFRSRKCLRVIRDMLRHSYVKRYHEVTGELFFFNVHTGESRREKPLLLPSDEGIQLENASDWECRNDPNSEFNTHPPSLGAFYYVHKQTGENSWYPPPSFITCFKCHARFVTRKKNETGHRYCVDCYVENMKEEGGEPEDWTKIPVIASKCIVCKSNPSTCMCFTCNGDPYCGDCARLIHMDPARYICVPMAECLPGCHHFHSLVSQTTCFILLPESGLLTSFPTSIRQHTKRAQRAMVGTK
jgi:hypothetical protein